MNLNIKEQKFQDRRCFKGCKICEFKIFRTKDKLGRDYLVLRCPKCWSCGQSIPKTKNYLDYEFIENEVLNKNQLEYRKKGIIKDD